jgi:AcrR family transcriptional regulator
VPRKARKRRSRSGTQERARLTRDAIVEAAARILGRSGDRALNTNEIARIAGVSVGAVYHHFRDKDEIVDAVGKRLLERDRAGLLEGVRDLHTLDTDEQIRAVIRAVVRNHLRDRELRFAIYRLLIARRKTNAIHEQRRSYRAIIEPLLEQHARRLGRSASDMAWVCVHASLGVLAGTLDRYPITEERLAEELAALAIGYVTRPLAAG